MIVLCKQRCALFFQFQIVEFSQPSKSNHSLDLKSHLGKNIKKVDFHETSGSKFGTKSINIFKCTSLKHNKPYKYACSAKRPKQMQKKTQNFIQHKLKCGLPIGWFVATVRHIIFSKYQIKPDSRWKPKKKKVKTATF